MDGGEDKESERKDEGLGEEWMWVKSRKEKMEEEEVLGERWVGIRTRRVGNKRRTVRRHTRQWEEGQVSQVSTLCPTSAPVYHLTELTMGCVSGTLLILFISQHSDDDDDDAKSHLHIYIFIFTILSFFIYSYRIYENIDDNKSITFIYLCFV